MILLSSLVLLCFAPISCCYECGGGMCMGWGNGGGSTGIPTHLAHLAFALPLCWISPATHGKWAVLFVKLSAPRAVHAILVFQASGDPEEAAWCGGSVSGRSTIEFIHPPVKGPFLLLFLAKIHQFRQVGQFEPSRGQRSRSLPQSQSSPPL